jgi:hypothetical protein
MMAAMTEPDTLSLRVGDAGSVSALLRVPERARTAFVFAHGAGAGMDHPFMTAFAEGLAAREVATLRYQFPFMQNGSRRTDPPALAQATVRAAVVEAGRRLPGMALYAGGKSFGGRMTSQAQAAEALPGVRGLVFVGFPLHPPGKPGVERAAHLAAVSVPMLFLQGTRDELADLALIRGVAEQHPLHATLEVIDDADHAFHVRKRSGRDDAQVREEMLDAMVAWIATVAP